MPDTPATVTSVCQHFKKCMEAFSRQEAVNKLLADGNPYIFSQDEHSRKYTIADDHPLLSGQYPQTVWSVEILADEFLRYYFQYQTFSEEVCREIRKNMAIRLAEYFEVALPGIDLDVITAIGGERYESAAGTGLSMTMIPPPLTPDHLKKLGMKGTAIFEPNAWLRLSFENIHSLRKQLNMAKDASLAVCY